MVKVNDTPVDYWQGMTLADALAESRVDTESPILITVNEQLLDKSDYVCCVLPDNAEIRVMRITSGG